MELQHDLPAGELTKHMPAEIAQLHRDAQNVIKFLKSQDVQKQVDATETALQVATYALLAALKGLPECDTTEQIAVAEKAVNIAQKMQSLAQKPEQTSHKHIATLMKHAIAVLENNVNNGTTDTE